MMPVWVPAVGRPVLYCAGQSMGLWCFLSCYRSSCRLWGPTAARGCLGLIVLLFCSRLNTLWRYSDVIPKQRSSDSCRYPSLTEGCSSSIQVKPHHREKLGLYHSTRKKRGDWVPARCVRRSPEKSGNMVCSKKWERGSAGVKTLWNFCI